MYPEGQACERDLERSTQYAVTENVSDYRESWGQTSPEEPLKEHISNNSKNPTWYLHQCLREDCARRGGCCGCDCGGCCEKDRGNSQKSEVVRWWTGGHCPTACGQAAVFAPRNSKRMMLLCRGI